MDRVPKFLQGFSNSSFGNACSKMCKDVQRYYASSKVNIHVSKKFLGNFFDQCHLDTRIICNSLFFFTTWKNLEHHIDKVHVRLVQWYFTRKQGMVEWNSWTDLVVWKWKTMIQRRKFAHLNSQKEILDWPVKVVTWTQEKLWLDHKWAVHAQSPAMLEELWQFLIKPCTTFLAYLHS